MDKKPEDIEARMNIADEAIDKALTLPDVDSSEAYCVKSMVSSARIMENPMKLGAKYGPLAAEYLEMAKTMNPENPRVYLLAGEAKYYTPAMWGGSKKEAKKLFEQSKEKFDAETPSSEIVPQWGESRVDQFLTELK